MDLTEKKIATHSCKVNKKNILYKTSHVYSKWEHFYQLLTLSIRNRQNIDMDHKETSTSFCCRLCFG